MRYFIFVGGALLTLLLIASACLPALPEAPQNPQPTADLSVIRIHSDHKWPERVVFDTSHPTTTPAPAPAAIVAEAPAPPKTAAEPAKSPTREAFAQMRPNPNDLRTHDQRRKRRSVAKNYFGPPRIVVAQQQRPVFFFGNNVW